MSEDPENRRVAELLDKLAEGRADEAEREELLLHGEGRPEVMAAIRVRAGEGTLGEGWLARLEKDRQVQALEGARGTRLVRGGGAAAIVLGLVLAPFSAPLATLALLGGTAVLLASYVRGRIREHHLDPYKDIRR